MQRLFVYAASTLRMCVEVTCTASTMHMCVEVACTASTLHMYVEVALDVLEELVEGRACGHLDQVERHLHPAQQVLHVPPLGCSASQPTASETSPQAQPDSRFSPSGDMHDPGLSILRHARSGAGRLGTVWLDPQKSLRGLDVPLVPSRAAQHQLMATRPACSEEGA